MKTLISIIILALTLTCLAQESVVWKDPKPEKQEYKFPEGYSPDGRVGSLALTVFGGYLGQSNDWNGYHVNGRVDFIMDASITLFIGLQYQSLSYGSDNLISLPDQTATAYSIGFRIFGGMK